jgi:hypothetical protein
MTQKPVKSTIAKAGGGLLRALGDLFLLLLLLGAAGGAGYWFGTIQRMAPVQLVGPGTPGTKSEAPNTVQAKPPAGTKPEPAETEQPEESVTVAPTPVAAASKKHGKKYWIASSGSDYIGYSIKVNVNDQDVDNFFAPGKAVDVTRMLKKGENTITFNAQELEEKFNAHKGDDSKKLILKLISGPTIQEDYKPSDVILSYQRNAAQTENDSQTLHFTKSN